MAPPYIPSTRDLTVVRIPMRRAKHHLGVATDRGSRPYNEDRDQAGTISIPAFAKRAPRSVQQKPGEATPADSALGDPQVFYFGVFDGHGGTQCADFARDEMPGYIERAAKEFGLQSSLRKRKPGRGGSSSSSNSSSTSTTAAPATPKEALNAVDMKDAEEVKKDAPKASAGVVNGKPIHGEPMHSATSPPAEVTDRAKAIRLEKDLVMEYRKTIGGYFRRFHPEHFVLSNEKSEAQGDITIESVMTYAFLRADLDFVSAQAER